MRAGLRLHHPHAGPGRDRPLPRGAHGALLRARSPPSAASPSTSSWPSAAATDEPGETRFNMAVMGLRLAARRNGVAALHGAVSRAMFAGLWPDVPTDEVPDRLGHERGPRPDVDLPRGRRPPHPPGRCPSGTARRPRTGPGSTRWATTSCGGPCSRAGSASSPSCAATCADSRLAQGFSASDVAWTNGVLDPTVLHRRLRPALRHLQAGHAPAVPARAAAGPPLPPRAAGPDGVRRQGPPGRPARARR